MRFNDILRTVLANAGEGPSATLTRWRQCIDLLAQHDISGSTAANSLDPEHRELVLDMLAEMRPQVSLGQRISSVMELGRRLRSPGLVRLLSDDHPKLVAGMIGNVQLSDEHWAEIIPQLGPLARSVLRRRADLGDRAQAVLRQFGSIDLALPALLIQDADAGEIAQVADAAPEPAIAVDEIEAEAVAAQQATEVEVEPASQIGRLVAQIEKFTETRTRRDEVPANIEPDSLETIEQFSFEADATGVLQRVEGAPRSAVQGLSIGTPAVDSRHGADGTALGAFRRRSAFANARFMVADGLLEGEWRMSAEPLFDKASGRFLGYSGAARREFPHERMVRGGTPTQPGWSGLSAAGTRQLIHELRTPLNAIQGYAELIAAQTLGPVNGDYRDMARRILADARTLLATFDDLDTASRIERGDSTAAPEAIDMAQAVRQVSGSFGAIEGANFVVEGAETSTMVDADRTQVERMLSHLLRAGFAALGEGEKLQVRLQAGGAGAVAGLLIERPAALHAVADQDLLDHGYLVDQKLKDAPPLGLAFTLKLVRGIAQHLGGRFEISPEAFILSLPAATAMDGSQENLR